MRPQSKSAAKTRREKENTEFTDLAALLPLPAAIASPLDKASVIRLTTSYLKLREIFPEGYEEQLRMPKLIGRLNEIKELASHILQTIDGFVFVISCEGQIMYVSETAAVHFGIKQAELVGNSIFDYIHAADHEEMANVLHADMEHIAENMVGHPQDFEIPRTFYIRIKCVLGKRNAGLATDGYKVIHGSGYLKLRQYSLDVAPCEGPIKNLGLVAIGSTLPSTSGTEVRLGGDSFMFRATLDSKIIFLDSKVTDLTGYDLAELLDKSYYRFIHAEDVAFVRACHEDLMIKGQVTTPCYRFLPKGRGCLWMQTQMALITNLRCSRPQCIVAINQVISSSDCIGYALSTEQSGENSVHANGAQDSSKEPRSPSPAKRKRKTASKAPADPSPNVPESLNVSQIPRTTSLSQTPKGQAPPNEMVGQYSEQFYGVNCANLVGHAHLPIASNSLPCNNVGLQLPQRKIRQSRAPQPHLPTMSSPGSVTTSWIEMTSSYRPTGPVVSEAAIHPKHRAYNLYRDSVTGERRYCLRPGSPSNASGNSTSEVVSKASGDSSLAKTTPAAVSTMSSIFPLYASHQCFLSNAPGVVTASQCSTPKMSSQTLLVPMTSSVAFTQSAGNSRTVYGTASASAGASSLHAQSPMWLTSCLEDDIDLRSATRDSFFPQATAAGPQI